MSNVHLLPTYQSTASNGVKVSLIVIGQEIFKNRNDTLTFMRVMNESDSEYRTKLLNHIRAALIPYLAKTNQLDLVSITAVKTNKDSLATLRKESSQKDKWNYWVFNVGASGNIDADAVYKNRRYSGSFSANRTTEDLKVSFSFYGSKNKSIFEYEDDAGQMQKVSVNNHNYEFEHYLVKSIDPHWSYGYETSYSQDIFSNNKGQLRGRAAIEYNIFPYKEVNNRYFTISYGITARQNRYYDSTIYNKLKETLVGHKADVTISFNQKWGTSSAGVNYHNYFHNWKLFNLGINASTDIRITGGLSFNISLFGALTRDQINLPKGGATEQEILTRRRQIASGYSYYTSIGLNYRFGSRLSNFVNPRFEGPN